MAKFPRNPLKKGDRIRFKGDKKFYKVRCADERYAICTLPYNFRPMTVVYTIIDIREGICGTDDMVFGIHDYYSDEDCDAALRELRNGELGLSRRNRRRLEVEKVLTADGETTYDIISGEL